MEILGFAAAVFIGIILGLVGAGGSILTVPVLVYLFQLEPVTATAYSLIVVGMSALAGSAAYMKNELVSYRSAAVFAAPALIAVFVARKFVLPAIPEELFTVAGVTVTRGAAVMLLFAALMILAAVSMIRTPDRQEAEAGRGMNYPLIALQAYIIGTLTGLVGAGGGFLIIPALVTLLRLPMKTAVGTSLLIIAVNSFFGVLGDLGTVSIDWRFVGIFTAFAMAGILIGNHLSRRIAGAALKPAFGWFILAMGVYIIGSEVIHYTT